MCLLAPNLPRWTSMRQMTLRRLPVGTVTSWYSDNSANQANAGYKAMSIGYPISDRRRQCLCSLTAAIIVANNSHISLINGLLTTSAIAGEFNLRLSMCSAHCTPIASLITSSITKQKCQSKLYRRFSSLGNDDPRETSSANASYLGSCLNSCKFAQFQ